MGHSRIVMRTAALVAPHDVVSERARPAFAGPTIYRIKDDPAEAKAASWPSGNERPRVASEAHVRGAPKPKSRWRKAIGDGGCTLSISRSLARSPGAIGTRRHELGRQE